MRNKGADGAHYDKNCVYYDKLMHLIKNLFSICRIQYFQIQYLF